jgi:hypothetical protein
VNFEGLINHNILVLGGKGHSVRDVIKLAANVAGGVHRTDDPREKQKLIADYSRSLSVGGLPGAIRQMQAIARVSLKGLATLIKTIEANGWASLHRHPSTSQSPNTQRVIRASR